MKVAYNSVIQLVQAAIELSPTTTPSKCSTYIGRIKKSCGKVRDRIDIVLVDPPSQNDDDELPL